MASNLTKEEQAQTKVIVEGTLSYPKVFTPEEDDNGKLKYSTAIIFDPGYDTKAITNAIALAIKDKWGTKKPANLTYPLRSDAEDVAEKGYPKGSSFMNVRTEQAPGIVDAQLKPITDEKEIYAGVRVRVSLRAFAYDRNGKRGVSFGLNNIQKIKDGPRLDGRKAAQDEFEALAPAALDDAMAGLK